jgi:hypothetical protein
MPVLIFAALFVAFGNAVQVQRDHFGLSFSPAIANRAIAVRDVDPHSAAAAAGIRKGDVIRLSNSRADRLNFSFPTPGVRVPVVVNGTRTVTLVGGPAFGVPFEQNLAFKVVRFAYLFIAAVLAWRRPDDAASRALVIFLFCTGFGISLNNDAFLSPLLSLIVLQILSTALLLYSMAAGARFVAIFPSGKAPDTARALANAATTTALLGIATLVAASLAPNSSPQVITVATTVVYCSFLVSIALLFATLIERYVHSPAAERKRRLWIFAILGAGLLGPAIDLIVQFVAGFNQAVDLYASLTLIVIPVGLAYVILRHRVIDVGFVLNRATVYAITSILIVGVFVIVETLLSKYVESTSHATSTAVQLAVALILGFSVRAIHGRVDRFVDTVLFRERHEAEAAMRTFAHDASYVTDSAVLTSRCVETVLRYAGATAAGIWMRDADARYVPVMATFPQAPAVDENDPAIVAMRARRVVADTGERRGSLLPGVLAFPMIVRGELIGTLVCGAKLQDETYAPDERDALEAMAAAVGHAYDALEVRDLRKRLGAAAVPSGGTS